MDDQKNIKPDFSKAGEDVVYLSQFFTTAGNAAAAMAEQAHIADILGFVAPVVYSPYI